MGYSEPHQRSLGAAACYLLFMLTRALLMTSSQSKAGYLTPANVTTIVKETSGHLSAELMKHIIVLPYVKYGTSGAVSGTRDNTCLDTRVRKSIHCLFVSFFIS